MWLYGLELVFRPRIASSCHTIYMYVSAAWLTRPAHPCGSRLLVPRQTGEVRSDVGLLMPPVRAYWQLVATPGLLRLAARTSISWVVFRFAVLSLFGPAPRAYAVACVTMEEGGSRCRPMC